jgi:hypothetical protein
MGRSKLLEKRNVKYMSWTNIDLSKISLDTELIPEGVYTLELSPGAKYNDWGALQCQGRVINDGEFKGKPVFFSYPDPEGVSKEGKPMAWSATAFKRLTVALGEDLTEGETPDVYLNRVAGTHFSAPITHTVPTEEYPVKKLNVKIFNVKAAG